MNETEANPYRRRPSVAGWLLIGCSSAVLLIGLLPFLSRQIHVGELANSFRLQIAAVLLVMALVSLLARMRIWSAVQVAVALLVVWPVLPSWLPSQQPASGEKPISLISFNVLAGNEDKETAIEMLCDQIPDILVILEFSDSWTAPFERVANAYPYSIREPRSDGFGIAIFSRFPLSNEQIESVHGDGYPFIMTDMDVGNRMVTFAAGHFLAPVTGEQMKIRNAQLEQAAEFLRQRQKDENQPIVLAGDFNAVPWSPFMADLLQATGLRDSRAGSGYAGSWPATNPLLLIPIDNVYISESVHVHGRKVLDPAGSDHLPIWLEFSIAGNNPAGNNPAGSKPASAD